MTQTAAPARDSAHATVDPRSWDAPRPSGVRRFVPLLSWLPAYDRRFLRFDIVAGATIWGLLVARRAGTLATLGEDRTFHTVGEAVDAIRGRGGLG